MQELMDLCKIDKKTDPAIGRLTKQKESYIEKNHILPLHSSYDIEELTYTIQSYSMVVNHISLKLNTFTCQERPGLPVSVTPAKSIVHLEQRHRDPLVSEHV